MKNGTYSYCLLQYHHSQLLGEVLNIGLLVYFPEYKRLDFIFPDKLIRLKFAYPNVPEKTIKAYFKFFTRRVIELNLHPEIFSDYELSNSLEQFVNKELIASDSSALQFGNYRTAVLYTANLEHIKNQLYNTYFSVFQIQDDGYKRIDESHLLIQYKSLIKEYIHQDKTIAGSNRFHYDFTVETSKDSKLTFDIAWQDNKRQLHLVKPISFDLTRTDAIDRKAYQYYGQFTKLQQEAMDKDYQFDVIVAKPHHKSSFAAYEKAVKLLQEPARVRLIDQNELVSYSKATVESALS